jgi:pimeloyl-ACP methyl ester carboxylesterase
MTFINRQKNLWKWAKRIMTGLLSLVLALIVLTYAAGAAAKSNLIRDFPPPGKLVDVGGYRMHLYCTGEGKPTVILESGLNDFYVSWAKVQPEIAKVTQVCSYDRAGLGWSETSPDPRTSEVMAEELHTLLDNAEIAPPYILAGHSFGGIVMRAFAHRYPDEVIGMALVDSAHEEQGVHLPFLKDAAENMIGQFRTLSVISSFGLMALSPETIPNRGFPDEAYKQYQAVLATTNYFDGAIAETTAFYFKAPSLKITGVQDLPLIVLSHGLTDTTSGIAPSQQDQFEQEWAKMQTELTGLSSKSKRVSAQKSGHYIQLDQPELVIKAILDLMQASR